jgi:hypothetical protein
MTVNRRAAHHARRWITSAGLAAAAIAVFGTGIAQADTPADILDQASGAASAAITDGVPVTTGPGPDALLSATIIDFTDANQVLNEVPAIGTAAETAFTNEQLDIQYDLTGLPLSGATGQLADLQSAEDVILSYNNGALASLVTPLFTNLDQNWYQVSEAVLSADQGFEIAAATGSTPVPAELALYAADLTVLGDAANSLPIEWASSLF